MRDPRVHYGAQRPFDAHGEIKTRRQFSRGVAVVQDIDATNEREFTVETRSHSRLVLTRLHLTTMVPIG